MAATYVMATPTPLVHYVFALDLSHPPNRAPFLGDDFRGAFTMNKLISHSAELGKACHECAPAAMAILVTLGFCGALATLLFKDIPPESRKLIEAMISLLGTGWTSIIAFYCGTRGR